MNKSPLAKYDIENNDVEYRHVPELVWAALLDKRYKMEVIRELSGTGTFVIYDSEQQDSLIHEETTKLSYSAVFGPDMMDVYRWQERGCEIVDAL